MARAGVPLDRVGSRRLLAVGALVVAAGEVSSASAVPLAVLGRVIARAGGAVTAVALVRGHPHLVAGEGVSPTVASAPSTLLVVPGATAGSRAAPGATADGERGVRRPPVASPQRARTSPASRLTS